MGEFFAVDGNHAECLPAVLDAAFADAPRAEKFTPMISCRGVQAYPGVSTTSHVPIHGRDCKPDAARLYFDIVQAIN